MDGRGRELQQVETGSRFWWRALDAHTPEPVMSQPHRFANWHYPVLSHKPGSRSGQALQRPGHSLQIHRSQRRSRRRSAGSWRGAVIVAMFLAVLSAAGAVAVIGLRADFDQPREALAGRAVQALVAMGFGIDQVSVSGQRYTEDRSVFDALDLPNAPTFADFDAEAALKRIERISWVDTAQITRVYPGALAIDIRERVPVAIWARGDKRYLIDATGRILGPVPATSGWELPLVTGESANQEVMGLLLALGRHNVLEAQFGHADRVAERRWRVVLKNGARLELGADREVEGLELIATNSTLQRILSSEPVAIDVRTPGRIALRPLTTQTAVRLP
jgi:cell division protein FtsQ